MERDSISVSSGDELIKNGNDAMTSTSCLGSTGEEDTSKAVIQDTQTEDSDALSNPEKGNPFHRLPEAVIKRILYLVDANIFASLALLNKKWRRISTSPHLYHYHLSSYSIPESSAELSDTPTPDDDIEDLKRKFATVTRKNIFEVFLRPKQTVVKLISASASSSSAFPQGEALRFSFSAYGRQLLGLSSSRIFVIDLTLDPISVSYELKILRRPIAAAILDDGTLLAVASSEHQVHVYSLGDRGVKLTQTIDVTGIPRTLAFSPLMAVLAVAYDEGIEIYALGENALPTARRAVRCFDVVSLSFCRDGSMLLGSSDDLGIPSLVTVSPPLLTDPDSEISLQELQSRMWTTQILFPDVNESYSHVELISPTKDSDGAVCFVGYDSELKTFRMEPVDDIGSGTLFFTGPGANTERDEPGPCTMPAASEKSEFLAVGYEESGIWVYGIPTTKAETLTPVDRQRLQQPPATVRSARGNVRLEPESTNSQRLKKTIDGPGFLIPGYPLSALNDISALRWVHNTDQKEPGCKNLCRLVAVAPGGVDSVLDNFSGERMPIDGGRIVLFDFQHSPTDGQNVELTIEVGEATPIELPEHGTNLDAQVELERRRTRVNRRGGLGGGASVARYSTQIRRDRGPRTASQQNGRGLPNSSSPGEIADIPPFSDNPYSNTSPRSGDTLRRAATAATQSFTASRYQNFRTPLSSRRRARQFVVPHESDADNWVPPPPPYTADAENPLPDHLRRVLLPSMTEPTPPSPSNSQHSSRSQISQLESMADPTLQRSRTNIYPTNQGTNRHSVPSRGSLANGHTRNSSNPLEASTGNDNLPNAGILGGNAHIYTHATTSDISLGSPGLRQRPRPPLPQLNTNITQQSSAAVIGRNGPSHHLSQDINSSQIEQRVPTTEPLANQRNTYTSSTTIPRSPLPDVPMLPVQRQVSQTNSLPTDALPTSNPSAPYPRTSRWFNPNHDILSTANGGIERSRSRSQVVPRRRSRTVSGGLFDRRTGRKALSSPSDAGINPNTRTDDLKEQWNKLVGEKMKKKDFKCVVM